MKRIKIFTMAFVLLMSNLSLNAQIEKAMKSYNFSRAMEEQEQGNNDEALDFLYKEIAEHPDNAYAFYFLAIIHARDTDYEEAMQSINMAIKKLPKKDKVYLSSAYVARGQLYDIAGDTIKCLSDFDTAVKINPANCEIYETRAQYLYEMDRYADADADYHKIIELNPMSVIGYMGLGRNACARDDYDGAIRQYDKVIDMYDDYSSAYTCRGMSYLKEGKYLKAIDDLVKALSIDSDVSAYYYLFCFPQDQIPLVAAKLKGMAVKDPNNVEWHYYLGLLYQKNKMYREAINAYAAAFEIDAYPLFLKCMADCYVTLGEFSSALELINQAQQMQPDDTELIQLKADILGDSGDVDGAIAEWTRFIEKNPDKFSGYYRRAFFEDNSRRQAEALRDYNMAIMLNPDFAYAYLGKGDMLTLQGLDAEAKAAYTKVVELDTVPKTSSCAMYALLALGEKDRAIDFMDRVIAIDTLDCGSYYDGACLYSRMGDLDKSLEYLRQSLALGYKCFHHIYADDDLEKLRETEAFAKLMEEYLPDAEPSDNDTEVEETVSQRVEIPFTPEGGCVSVKCSINGLPLSFIFDTGASTVSMSMVEANFMLKNGYLHKEDIVGSQRFVDANGDISEGTVVILRNVDFGGLTLTNVRASVVRNQRAPLLLGQSVLGRMGTIEIDNQNRKLIITNHSKSK